MSLRLRQYADASPDAHWSRDGRKYVVMSNRTIVGTIMHNAPPVGREYWMWHSNITGAPRGFADTKEDAMRAFASAWRAWLAEAGLVEVEPAPLNGGTPWTESVVADLVASLQAGDDVVEVALFLQREEAEVWAKMVEMGLNAEPAQG